MQAIIYLAMAIGSAMIVTTDGLIERVLWAPVRHSADAGLHLC